MTSKSVPIAVKFNQIWTGLLIRLFEELYITNKVKPGKNPAKHVYALEMTQVSEKKTIFSLTVNFKLDHLKHQILTTWLLIPPGTGNETSIPTLTAIFIIRPNSVDSVPPL